MLPLSSSTASGAGDAHKDKDGKDGKDGKDKDAPHIDERLLATLLSRAIAPADEVRDWMKHVFKIGVRADERELVLRLPKYSDEDGGNRDGAV